MTTAKITKNNEHSRASSGSVLSSLKSMSLSKSTIAQAEAVLKIGSNEKTGLIPFICKMVSEQSVHFYSDCLDKLMEEHKFTDEDVLNLYLKPEIKEYLSGIDDWSSEIDIANTIDRKFQIEHPREKIAYLYYMGKRGSVYGMLNAGSRMCRLDEDPDFLFNMPLLCAKILKEGITKLKASDSDSVMRIRTSMQSLVVESHIKYILAMLEMGESMSGLCNEIEWIMANYPQHQRWVKLVNKNECLSNLFT